MKTINAMMLGVLATGCGVVDSTFTDAAQRADGPLSDAAPPDTAPPDAPLRCDPTGAFDSVTPLPGFSRAEDPRLSSDELTLYFARWASGQGLELYVATRPSRMEAFGTPTSIPGVGSPSDENFPNVSVDGRTIIFDSARSGQHIYVSTRPSTDAAFGVPVLAAVNSQSTTDIDFQSFLTADGAEIWFASNRAGGVGDFDILRAVKHNGAWGAPVGVAELESTTADLAPIVSADRLTVYFVSWQARSGSLGGYDIWTSHRATTSESFPPPVLAGINTTSNEFTGWLSPDDCRLYFASDRSGTLDLYVAERSPVQ